MASRQVQLGPGGTRQLEESRAEQYGTREARQRRAKDESRLDEGGEAGVRLELDVEARARDDGGDGHAYVMDTPESRERTPPYTYLRPRVDRRVANTVKRLEVPSKGAAHESSRRQICDALPDELL